METKISRQDGSQCGYQFRYAIQYLPKKYEATSEQQKNREIVWNFKNGNIGVETEEIWKYFVREVCDIVKGKNKSDFIVCFIPASNAQTSYYRYNCISYAIMKGAGVQTSMKAISRPVDTAAEHQTGKSGDPTEGFVYDADLFKGKKVILIDDVITRGTTFTKTADKLVSLGAASVTGLFLAATFTPEHRFRHLWQIIPGTDYCFYGGEDMLQ